MLDYFKELRTGHPDVYRSKLILWNVKEITIENKSVFWAHLLRKESVLFKTYETKTEGGRNIKTQDWPFMKKLSNYITIEENPRTFPAKVVKQNCLGGSLSATKCYP